MESRKIISDEVDYIFTPSDRKEINNALVLTGGGTLQAFFAMGAVGCLIDNGLFDFELITAVSGGTLLLTFIDLCNNTMFNYSKKKNWYNRYVRKSIYKLATSKFIAYFIKTRFDLQKTQEYVFKQIPEFNKSIESETTDPNCEYNYIDANKKIFSCDHTDIIDIKNNIKQDYWFFVRPARCTLPFFNFYNRPTYDAGNVGNIPVSTLLTRYSPKRTIIIKVYSNLIYDKYPDLSYFDLLTGWLFTNMAASENSLNNTIDLSLPNNNKNIMCSMSNSYNKSKDKYHKNLFDNVKLDIEFLKRLYNGIVYINEDIMKIIENEGYIQMYYQLKRTGEANKFKIPNPDVYNKDVKEKIKKWKQTNVYKEFFNDIYQMKV